MTSPSPLPVSIIVAYHPDIEKLGRLIESCAAQCARILIVDNGGGSRLAEALAARPQPGVTLLPLGGNLGIAAAQNAGIAWARTQGAAQILIFDQDSRLPPDLVARLQAALAELESRGGKVAAVGPRCVDSRWQDSPARSPFSRIIGGRMTGCYPENNSPYVALDFLIASGSLIPMPALDAVGGMMEDLFIDYVDIEWGLRARQAGWSIYGVWDCVMEHSLGDDRVAVLGRRFPVHSPLRHYYAIRNAVWLCLRSALRLKWKIGIAHNALRRFVAYSLFMPQPWTHFRYMCIGIWDGLIGRMGKARPALATPAKK